MRRSGDTGDRRGWAYWVGLILVVSLLCLFCVSFLWVLPGSGQSSGPRYLPANLHSVLNADYRADERALVVPAVEVALVEEAIRDEIAVSASQVPERVQSMVVNLQTPVPTVTPYPRPTQPGQPTSPAAHTPQAAATATPVPATVTQPAASPTPSRTSTEIHTPSPTPTFAAGTSVVLPTRTPTRIPTRIPTLTPGGNVTSTPHATHTYTPVPPTRTSTSEPPTRTPTSEPPTRTPTPIPPTNTPVSYPPPDTPVPQPTNTPSTGVTPPYP